jgi:hypothetical protein
MTTKKLSRYYQTLTPWERLPLIVAASERGDAVEREQLVRSSLRHGFRVPDYWGLAEELDELAAGPRSRTSSHRMETLAADAPSRRSAGPA